MNPKSQRGVALVITLIMVSIITLLAVSFLALSRRDRASVAVSQSDTVARLAAQAAEAHAQAEIMARIISSSNSFGAYPSYIGYSNSFDRAGGVLVSTNVDIVGIPGARFTPLQTVTRMALLRQSPRVPVLIKKQAANGSTFLDDRFYLDFNRNGVYDPAGWNTNGNFYAGDPEWIGVLEHPEVPQSGTNRFAFRYAYMVLPIGNSLDLNYIHNYALGGAGTAMGRDRFSRNQGVGPWEINLAAFLQDLSPNFYPAGSYSYTISGSPIGVVATSPSPVGAFNDAVGLLKFRYNNAFNLPSLANWFLPLSPFIFKNDFIDSYSLAPVMVPPYRNTLDPDVNSVATVPWAGSTAPNSFFDMQDLFKMSQIPHFTNIMFQSGRNLAVPDDRYLYYRLLSQLSTGSEPELKGKINLNYDNEFEVTNRPALNTSQTRFLPWKSTNFFKLAAQSILQANMITNFIVGTQQNTNFFIGGIYVATNFGVTNIEIYPANQYTPLVHQLLQVALNLYDSTTNRVAFGMDYPTVLRPIVSRGGGNRLYISDWVEVEPNDVNVTAVMSTNTLFHTPDPTDPSFPRGNLSPQPALNPFVYGLPWIIGAKKGFPNFNELNISTSIYAERKLQLTRPSPQHGPLTTNQMMLLSITNSYAIEGWNSYSNAYPAGHTLQLSIVMQSSSVLTNKLGKQVWPTVGSFNANFGITTNISSWPGTAAGARAFIIPLLANIPLLTNSVYTPSRNPPFSGYNGLPSFDLSVRDGFPDFQLYFVMTNSLRYAVKDLVSGRLIDFVTFTNLSAFIDIAGALSGITSGLPGEFGSGSINGKYWLTNRASANAPPDGLVNQMQTSEGTPQPPNNADPNWTSESGPFQTFVQGQDPINVAKAAPFAPYRLVVNQMNFEVNDPLVHYMLAEITDPNITNSLSYPLNSTANTSSTKQDSIGAINTKHYSPWGSPANRTSSTIHLNPAFIDPGVRSSDAWDFPTNKFPSLGWIGRVHRGTPWQTVYLKSGVAPIRDWAAWAGNGFSHPTNDWRLVDLFTTALNDNAATGLLPVNQAGLPAWSAVLSGVVVLTNNLAGTASIQPMIIQPASVSNPAAPTNSPVARIVASINATRNTQIGGTFQSVGQILQTPALSDASPFLDFTDSGGALSSYTSNPITDEAYERVPQQILSLIRLGQPRFVVYSFGQALKPADGSFVLDANLMSIRGAFNISTNYQIIGEAAYRTVFRLEGNPIRPNVVIESYAPLPPE